MVFSHNKETCKILIDYATIGGKNINDYVQKAIRNLLHENVDLHSRRLIT